MVDIELVGNARVAADLAAAGFSVFPCHAGGSDVKKPMPGVFWRSQSTTDRVKVTGWWRKWPDAAIGLDLAKSGLIVIDADRHGEEDGVAAIAELMHAHQFDPNDAPVVGTPNSGTHFYFRQPPGKALGNGRGGLPPGIDVRGAGGYVIAPGTVLADGRRYEAFGAVIDAPRLPDWLVSLIRAPAKAEVRQVLVPASERPSDERIAAYVDAALERELDAVRSAPRGQRNHQLNSSAFSLGQLVGAGWVGEGEVSAMLENAAADLAKDDGPVSVRKTIASGLRSGARQPRELPQDEYQVVSADDYAASAKLLAGMSKPTVRFDRTTGEVQEDIGNTDPIGGAVDQFDLPESAMQAPGVVGELADWICDWTAEPIRIHALGAALVIVGTLLGRKVYTRTRPSCTALYIGAIAPSGMGKQHPQDCIRLALDEVCGNGSKHMGWNVSLPALVVALQDQASKVMIADEFADKLIGLRSKNATTSQSAISEGLRSIWGTNTGTYSPDVSLSRGDHKIMRPNFSFYGASTIKDFARSLVSKDVTNGLFNRFLLLPRYGEVTKGREHDGVVSLPDRLKERLQWLNECLPPMELTLSQRGDGHPKSPLLIPFSAEAEAMNDANKELQSSMLRASDQDDALMLYGRYAEQIKRVAMIVACGRQPHDVAGTIIGGDDMRFAETLVRYSIDQFIVTVRRDMVESWVQAQHKLVLGIIRAAGEISRNELVRKIDGRIKGRDVEDLIKTLVAGDNVLAFRVEPGPKGGRPKEMLRYARG